ncbi:hypothetical protein [Sphingobium sp. TKS]|uniref:hypothetical protein n=1 Tax=Sphingobium sp. TKS TaxID=1315974 RepID=UPI000770435B|nr:hypothetical protein [Sphingobium sp. TKS]AMK26052.1 hypothetical protein K426_25760 [Sphingobium sp. TKS]
MTRLVKSAADSDGVDDADDQELRACISFILEIIDGRKLTLRALSLACGINKSRLGRILHRNPLQRRAPQLTEIHRIFRALGISLIEASVNVEARLCEEPEHRPLFKLLARFYVDLPRSIMQAIKEIHGVDGSFFKEEWSQSLTAGVTKKMMDTVLSMLARRNSFMEL